MSIVVWMLIGAVLIVVGLAVLRRRNKQLSDELEAGLDAAAQKAVDAAKKK